MSKALAKKEEAQLPAPAAEGDAIIMMIERAARDPNVDIEKMERLFAMRERMQAQAAKTAFLAAKAKLQAKLPAVERKGTGHNSKKYARFEDFIATIKPDMAEFGFSLTFRLQHEGNIIRVVGVLGHEAGHEETTDLPLPADNTGNKNAVQAWGSSISYGKRYVGMTLLGIATEDEDDDGQKALAGETIGQKQEEELQALIVATDSNLPRFYAHWSKQLRRNITCLGEIPVGGFAEVKASLLKKQEAKNGTAKP